MSRKVLVVDDEKLIVKGIRFSLEQDGVDVDCAYDGQEAIDLATNNKYDIILLDVMLPGLDGLTVCRRLRDEYGLRDDISVMSVAGNNDLFVTVKPEEDAERDWAEIEPVLGRAADAFFAAKEREGAALVADLGGKVADMRALAERIGEMSADTVKHYRERLAERVRDALADNHISSDESRILTECAIFADKVAVDEELVRLRTHLDAMEEILRGGDAVGRRLDFLIQEMNREVNTTGSKCTDAAVAQTVVDLKCTLEKVREQIQNLE